MKKEALQKEIVIKTYFFMLDGGTAAVGAEDVAGDGDELRALRTVCAGGPLDAVNVHLVLGLDAEAVTRFGRFGRLGTSDKSHAER